MLASEIIDPVRSEILEVSANFWSNTELLRILNRGLQKYVNETRMQESHAFLTTTPGIRRYVLPSTVLSVKLVMFKQVNDNEDISWKILTLSTIERIAREFPTFLNTSEINRGTPSQAAVYDRYLEFDRAPSVSSDSDLYIFFKSKPVDVPSSDSHIAIDDIATEGLIQFMLWKAWMKEKELALAKDAREEYNIEVRKGRRWVKKQMGMLRNRFDIESSNAFTTGQGVVNNPLNL